MYEDFLALERSHFEDVPVAINTIFSHTASKSNPSRGVIAIGFWCMIILLSNELLLLF